MLARSFGDNPFRWEAAHLIQNEKDYNSLLDALLPFGQRMLNQSGEFYPYAAVIANDQKVVYVAGHTGEEKPPANEVLELLMQGLQKQAREAGIRAAGICANVSILDPRNGRKSDALHFIFEHADGEAFDIIFPYRKRFLRGYRFDKPFAQPREKCIF